MWAMDAIGRAASGIASWGNAAAGIHLKVDQVNVMQAARLVMAESERFRHQVNSRISGLRVRPVGDDPVSIEAAEVLNLKFWESDDSYVARCLEYAEMLERLARQLGDAAEMYGHTEEEVSSMFASIEGP